MWTKKNTPSLSENLAFCGILPVCKTRGSSSFSLVSLLRKRTGISKIGHAGTLDPFATGVMILLIGREYTRLSDRYLGADKQYLATVTLGQTTDTFDCDGQILSKSEYIPSLEEVKVAIESFQGMCSQVPPMFSAKKIGGKKLYELARKGISIERAPIQVRLKTALVRYEYPEIELLVDCSKGTYIRSIAQDLGQTLQCGAFLSELVRTRSGMFSLEDCIPEESIPDPSFPFSSFLKKLIESE